IFLWSYAQASLTWPIRPPRQFELSPSEWASLEEVGSSRQRKTEYLLGLVRQRGLPVYTRANGNGIRICEDCRLIKPDRAHHCSTCGCCLLKMDHHCPWVNNCVGFHNYKFFVQFLMYGSLYCFYVGCTTAKYFVKFWTAGIGNVHAVRFHLLFLFFAAWMFCIALVGLGGYHLYLTLLNLTTLESFRAPMFEFGPDKRAYHAGLKNNFKQVFGNDRLMWLLPMYSSQGSGLVFPTRHEFGEDRDNLLAGPREPDSDVEANK
ncbi:hypothetical protein BOX15_Mlig006787g1, partial [Macrostomum lignano]